MTRGEHKPVIVPLPPASTGPTVANIEQRVDGILNWSREIVVFLQTTLEQSGVEFDANSVTLSAGAGPETVSNVNVTSNSRIMLFPTNSAAATLMGLSGSDFSVVRKISTWTSTTAANPFIADEYLPVDGASTSASYTPTTSGNSVLVIYMGGAWEFGDSKFGLKLEYDGNLSTQLCFYQDVSNAGDESSVGVAVFDLFTTGTGTDTVRVQGVSVTSTPALLVGTQRTLAVVEFNNTVDSAGTGKVYVDTKTVATGSFNINWTGTAAGTETFDYLIMHKRGL